MKTLTTYRRLVLCLTLFLTSAGLLSSPAQTLTQIRTNGPTSKCINLVYLSEGYTAAQLPKFLSDVTNVVNSLLSIPPWSAYGNYFNVFAISVASAQSGADHYTPTTNLVNTYFNSTFDSYGLQRLLTIPPNDRDSTYADGNGKVIALLQQFVPDYDLAGLVVNDTVYGGSGGTYLVVSVNSSSAEIANHEIGHTFAHLGDEYSSAYPGYPDTEEPNTTTNTNRATIKWNAWIDPATPVPTPDIAGNYTVDGLFQGAHYHDTGWYRPKHDCKMRDLGVPYCEICAQELVLSIYRVIRPIQGFSPASTNLSLGGSDTATFTLTTLKPSATPLNIQWLTNGVPAPGATSTNFTITGDLLKAGTNQVRAIVIDPTTLVRTDLTGVLRDTNTWTLVVVAAPTIINPTLSPSGTSFMLSLQSQVGSKYVLEFKNTLADATWTPLQTNSGNGGLITVTNTPISGPSRFYRLRVQ